jgi:hypothetical protein
MIPIRRARVTHPSKLSSTLTRTRRRRTLRKRIRKRKSPKSQRNPKRREIRRTILKILLTAATQIALILKSLRRSPRKRTRRSLGLCPRLTDRSTLRQRLSLLKLRLLLRRPLPSPQMILWIFSRQRQLALLPSSSRQPLLKARLTSCLEELNLSSSHSNRTTCLVA